MKKQLISLSPSGSGGGGITPSGNINITTTQLTDVTQYATAQVVDPNLLADNIKADVTILGIEGTFSGGGNKLPSVVDNTITELTSADLQGATKIKQYEFYESTTLTSIVIPSSVTSIGTYALSGCTNLTSVTFQNDSQLRYIMTNCFSASTFPSIVIPKGVEIIYAYAFNNCKNLTSVTFQSDSRLQIIRDWSFSGCSRLTSITLPSSLINIYAGAFNNCSALTDITILATTPPTLQNANAFNGSTCPIYVPAESVETYKAATNWSSLASRIQAIQG